MGKLTLQFFRLESEMTRLRMPFSFVLNLMSEYTLYIVYDLNRYKKKKNLIF